MTDYTDSGSINAFADEVDDHLDEAAVTRGQLWPLIGTWVLCGILLTLGVAVEGEALSTVFYVLGLVVVVCWMVGLARAGRDSDWFGS